MIKKFSKCSFAINDFSYQSEVYPKTNVKTKVKFEVWLYFIYLFYYMSELAIRSVRKMTHTDWLPSCAIV